MGSGRRPKSGRASNARGIPSPETSVLVPLDGSETSASILTYAIELAQKFTARLVLLNVSDESGRTSASDYLGMIGSGLGAKGVAHDVFAEHGDPAETIAAAAERERCELIVMSPHSKAEGGVELVGSTADRVIRSTAVPVMLIRPEVVRTTLKHWTRPPSFIVGLDGSALAATALEYATSYARRLGSNIVLVRATDRPVTLGGAASYYQSPSDVAMEYLRKAAAPITELGVKTRCEVFVGPADQELIKAADREDSAIIALCTRGLTARTGWVLGSTTDRVVRSARHPVLVIPPRAAQEIAR